MSDTDMQGIADRLFGGGSTPAASTTSETPAAATDTLADRMFPSSAPKPAATSNDAAEAARVAQLARGAAINERTAADKADAARKESFDQNGLWKPPGELPKGEVPDNIKAMRDTPERRLFSAQGSYAGVQLEAALKDVDTAPEVKTAAAAELREIFADIGASSQDAQEIVDAASRLHAEPMTPERDATNANDAIGALNREFGNDAKSALRDAVQMVTRDPRLARMLDASRLGNDPAVVVKLAYLARSQRARG
ncbi:hypothetical protein PQR75_13645 [Paraburkholderia fungorum]|uniref:hypothetical protein n=1 Tax=Paraburkholderia fungorum TaxID=134537 RepID=UPI0038B943F6